MDTASRRSTLFWNDSGAHRDNDFSECAENGEIYEVYSGSCTIVEI